MTIFRQDFIIDVTTGRLYRGNGEGVSNTENVPLYARDELVVTYTIVRDYGLETQAAVNLTGYNFRWGLKKVGELFEAAKLAFSDTDQVNIAGDWADAGLAAGKLSVRVDLNTQAIEALFSTGDESVLCRAELETVWTGGRVTTVMQYGVELRPDVVRGEAVSPAPGSVVILRVYDRVTETWRRVELDDGVLVVVAEA